jgi:hypothetical protein
MNLAKGATLKQDSTFNKHFSELARQANAEKISWRDWNENTGLLQLLFLQNELSSPEF